jgi:hypothetical protein
MILHSTVYRVILKGGIALNNFLLFRILMQKKAMPAYPLQFPLSHGIIFMQRKVANSRRENMTENSEQKNSGELLESNEAVKYLAQKWGMKSYGLIAFRSLRLRRGIKPTMQSKTSAWFSRELLDSIPKPARGRRRKENEEEGEEGSNSSVTYPLHSYSTTALGAIA